MGGGAFDSKKYWHSNQLSYIIRIAIERRQVQTKVAGKLTRIDSVVSEKNVGLNIYPSC